MERMTNTVTTESLLNRILERIEEEREDGRELHIHEAEARIKHVLSRLATEPPQTPEEACVADGGHFWNPEVGSVQCGRCGHTYVAEKGTDLDNQ